MHPAKTTFAPFRATPLTLRLAHPVLLRQAPQTSSRDAPTAPNSGSIRGRNVAAPPGNVPVPMLRVASASGCTGCRCFGMHGSVSGLGGGSSIGKVRVHTGIAPYLMSSAPVQYLEGGETCQRCKAAPAVLVARKERFCGACFTFFMRGKQRKLMLHERYKVKYGAVAERLGIQRVLLPLSFGESSLVLLDMVASLLHEQTVAHKGRQGFELVVMTIEDTAHADTRAKLEQLVARYAPVKMDCKLVALDEYATDPLMHLAVSEAFAVSGVAVAPPAGKTSVKELLAQAASVSLRADLLSVVYAELVLRTAIAEKCQTVVYGHSMTRLANEVISLTVKGRGLTVHEAVADRTVCRDGAEINYIFPLRDILLAEVKAILALSDLAGFVKTAATQSRIIKNMTVEALVGQYFDTLDATGYASTASTVVKTGEKLCGPKAAVEGRCRICGTAIHQQAQRWVNAITVNQSAPLVSEEEEKYAADYAALEARLPSGTLVDSCYGCTVTLAGAGPGFTWPVRASADDVVAEYSLE